MTESDDLYYPRPNDVWKSPSQECKIETVTLSGNGRVQLRASVSRSLVVRSSHVWTLDAWREYVRSQDLVLTERGKDCWTDLLSYMNLHVKGEQ